MVIVVSPRKPGTFINGCYQFQTTAILYQCNSTVDSCGRGETITLYTRKTITLAKIRGQGELENEDMMSVGCNNNYSSSTS